MEKNKRELQGRVGMLVHSYYQHDARVRREAEELASSGLDVHVICLRAPAQNGQARQSRYEISKGVHIHRISLQKKRGTPFRYLYEYAALLLLGMLKLARMHAKKPLDVVHIHNMPDMLIFAGLMPSWAGAHLILDVHDPMSELFQVNYRLKKTDLFYRLLKMEERISYRFADQIVTVSDPMARNIAVKIGCNERDIAVVQNLPDLSLFPVIDKIDRWPRHKDTFVVLYAGTIAEQYTLDIAVRAIAMASKTIKNIRFHIVGGGNRMQQIRELAEELGISDRVCFTKPVRQDKVKEIISEADVGISTHKESEFGDLYFSNKLVEYLTQGLPVVTSKTKTVARYLPEDTVFFFEPGNAEHCAQQLLTVWEKHDLVRQKLRNSRNILHRLNWQAEREKLISMYKKLLKKKQPMH